MSNTDPRPDALSLRASVVPAVDVLEARKAAIGDGTEVRRLLPARGLRTIGAWCFLDHYGPDDVSAGPGMRVPPHPHTGLQTASWLFEGLVRHRDSLGSEALIRPGELNLMTSGRAIAHSEESPRDRPARLHGVQLWIALPDERRFGDPDFAQHADLPVITTAAGPGRFFVIGGAPLAEKLLMWWNFVGRTAEEIITARDAWVTGKFGDVTGYAGDPLPAPPLPPGQLKPRLPDRRRSRAITGARNRLSVPTSFTLAAYRGRSRAADGRGSTLVSLRDGYGQ